MSVNPNMATQLKKTTENVKRYAVYFIIFILVVFLIDWISRGVVPPGPPIQDPAYENYPDPDNKFGAIPKPEITSINATTGMKGVISKKITEFPSFPPVMYVYKIKPEREYLNDAQLGKDVAKALKFPEDYTVLQNVMNWTSEDTRKTLTYDRFQKYFKYSYNNPELSSLSTEEKDTLLSSGFNILQTLKLKGPDLNEKASAVDLLFRSPEGNITSNVSTYNCAQIEINKYILASEADIDKIPDTMAPVKKYSYYKGIANLLIRTSNDPKNKDVLNDLIGLEYKALDYESDKGIYALKTVETAYQDLQLNKGFLYRLHLVSENYLSATINQYEIEKYNIDPALTKLIYIEPENRDAAVPWTNFLQPYYLFEGTATTTVTYKEVVFSFIVPALEKGSYTQ